MALLSGPAKGPEVKTPVGPPPTGTAYGSSPETAEGSEELSTHREGFLFY